MTNLERDSEINDYCSFINQVVDCVTSKFDLKKTNLTLFGFSQGTATVSRFAIKSNVQFKKIILWGGFLPFDSSTEDLIKLNSKSEIIFVVGTKDVFINDDKLNEKTTFFDSIKLNYKLIRYPGKHKLNSKTLFELFQ